MRKLLISILVIASAEGCKSACRQLSEKQCECLLTTGEQTTCLTYASNKEAASTVTDADNLACEGLLSKCDCRLIDTAQGKVNCGLARPLAGTDAGTDAGL